MKMKINDQTNIGDANLLQSLVRYAEMKEKIAVCNDNEIIIDLSQVRFAFPLFLNLLLVLRDSDRRIAFEGSTSYLDAIGFPDASSDVRIGGRKASFSPLVSASRADEKELQQSIASTVVKLITDTVDVPASVKAGIRYMLQELTDNVTQHSEAERFYVLAQAYQNKHFIDICIADNGIGLRRSYRNAGIDVRNDMKAMKNIASAISSKDRPENESRGYGLFTSRKMVTEGLQGEFVCISGTAAYTKIRDRELLLDTPNCDTQGTVVALRLKYDEQKFDMYNYLEY